MTPDPKSGPTVVSFRDHIYGSLGNLLDQELLEGIELRAGLLDAVELLSQYREEGVPLHPQVFVTTDGTKFRKLAGSPRYVCLGTCEPSRNSIREALKKCAPLARRGWVVLVQIPRHDCSSSTDVEEAEPSAPNKASSGPSGSEDPVREDPPATEPPPAAPSAAPSAGVSGVEEQEESGGDGKSVGHSIASSAWDVHNRSTLPELDPAVEFGLLRLRDAPLVPRLSSQTAELADGFALVSMVALADGVVEVRGGAGRHLEVRFSTAEPEAPSPTEALSKVVSQITSGVEESDSLLENFLTNALSQALLEAHGALIAVADCTASTINPDWFVKGEGLLSDGAVLDPSYDLRARVNEYRDSEFLQAEQALVTGMVASDGVTVFSRDGHILGYRIFVRGGAGVASGGARSRAFSVLHDHVGKELAAAFVQSQDGQARCVTNDKA